MAFEGLPFKNIYVFKQSKMELGEPPQPHTPGEWSGVHAAQEETLRRGSSLVSPGSASRMKYSTCAVSRQSGRIPGVRRSTQRVPEHEAKALNEA